MATKKTAVSAEAKDTATVAEAAAPAEKKAPAKKAAAKKPAAKKEAAPKKVAENVYVQYQGVEITSAGLIEKAKKDSGVKSIKKVDVYVKPEENMVYYVINDDAKGQFPLVD
jgi:hypothetical protein